MEWLCHILFQRIISSTLPFFRPMIFLGAELQDRHGENEDCVSKPAVGPKNQPPNFRSCNSLISPRPARNSLGKISMNRKSPPQPFDIIELAKTPFGADAAKPVSSEFFSATAASRRGAQ